MIVRKQTIHLSFLNNCICGGLWCGFFILFFFCYEWRAWVLKGHFEIYWITYSDDLLMTKDIIVLDFIFGFTLCYWCYLSKIMFMSISFYFCDGAIAPYSGRQGLFMWQGGFNQLSSCDFSASKFYLFRNGLKWSSLRYTGITWTRQCYVKLVYFCLSSTYNCCFCSAISFIANIFIYLTH